MDQAGATGNYMSETLCKIDIGGDKNLLSEFLHGKIQKQNESVNKII